MSTLGYTASEVFLKIDIATTQLMEAINLFVQESFICALTLAGASEEIYAGLLKARGETPILESSFATIEETRESLGIQVMGGMSKKEIIKGWNHAKNRSKHHDPDEASEIEFNACDEAYWMIKRSLENAKLLSVSVPNEIDFENWVVMNVCS